MFSRRRLSEWIHALRLAGATNVPWLGMVMAILGGPVPREVWRARMRTCLKCPIMSRPGGILICKSTHPDLMGLGCGCFLPYTALWREPYPGGCIGRSYGEDIGWPAHQFASLSDRLRSVLDFVIYPIHKRIRKLKPRNRPANQ